MDHQTAEGFYAMFTSHEFLKNFKHLSELRVAEGTVSYSNKLDLSGLHPFPRLNIVFHCRLQIN